MAALRDLRPSVLIAIVVAAGAAGAVALSGRAPDIKPEALKAAVQGRLDVPLIDLSIAPGGDAPWGPGEPVQLWLTAGDPSDLYHAPARQVGEAMSLLAAPRQVRATPLAAEEIVLTRADQALVALRDGAAIQVVALHAAAPMALYLNAPTKSLRGEWTPTGFAVTTDTGTVTVDTTTGTVAPGGSARWLTDPQPPPPPQMVGVDDPPAPRPHAWVAGEPLVRDGVTLTAFDSRDYALRYVPGVAYPGGVHGRPGPGSVPADARARLTVGRSGGAAVDGRLLAPLRRDGMAIAIDAKGKARVGLFAGEPVAPRDGVLRQAGVPLVLDGRPVRVSPDVPVAHGFGVTADGVIIVARGPARPRAVFAATLAQAGVVQAIALRPQRADDGQDDALLIVERRGFAAPGWRADGWSPLHRGLARRTTGAVTLALIAADANRATLAPGAADQGGAARAPTAGWCLTGGVRSERAPYGLKIGAEVRRTPREGVLSLLIDARGQARIGLSSANIDDAVSVLQGPQLIRDGRAAIEDRRVEPGVLTGVGARADGRLVFAHTRAEVGVLVDALLRAGVTDAIRLGDVSAPDAGRIVEADDLGDAQGTALCLTPAPPPPAVLPAKAIHAW